MWIWWYNNVMRHWWYYWNNMRHPKLPRIKPAKITPQVMRWAEGAMKRDKG